ncbi:hypothetical protein [Plantactinospora sp. WMMB782]|uniref:hypothetical protein n=1 Tax=Plantactinospora sp. WMMB782 TaxID=3404121 RepID=UPI003B94A6AA
MRSARIWPALLAAATAFALLGCATESTRNDLPQRDPDERMKPLVEQFRDARARARSDFEREALDRAIRTGKIDPVDYEEAFTRYRRCAQGAGLDERYTKLPNGIYRITPEAGNEDVEANGELMVKCAQDAGLVSLEALYRTQVDNPELLADPKLVVVRCLVKAGLVPPDYTVQKLSAFLEGAVEDMTDFDPTHPEAQKCLTAGGIALLIDRTPGSG